MTKKWSFFQKSTMNGEWSTIIVITVMSGGFSWDIPSANQTWLESPRFSSMAETIINSQWNLHLNSLGFCGFSMPTRYRVPSASRNSGGIVGTLWGFQWPGDFQRGILRSQQGEVCCGNIFPEKTRRQHFKVNSIGFFRGCFFMCQSPEKITTTWRPKKRRSA